VKSSLGIQIAYLARRSVLRTLRQPAVMVSALSFPMLLLAIQSGGLQPATEIPGFPADSYLDFLFAFPLVQGALFAATSAGTDLARDIETGFLSRLSLTPMRPVALLAGLLSGIVALGLLQGVVFLSIGLVAGVNIEAGWLGVPVLILLTTMISVGFGAVGSIMALRTGSGESVQALFPLLFVAIFLSSINLPRDLIATDWFRVVATINPVSYLVEGIRSLIITGWDPQALALGFGFAATITLVALFVAAASLRSRMERT
jgi:ABC-2 type transport system permease protein